MKTKALAKALGGYFVPFSITPARVSRFEVMDVDEDPERGVAQLIKEALGEPSFDSRDATCRLVTIALNTAICLEMIAEKSPEELLIPAIHRGYWPVVAYARDKNPSRIRDVFKAIQLGGHLIELRPEKAKWKSDRATKIAFDLLLYLRFACLSPLTYGEIGKAARALPALCPDSHAAWWELAWKALLKSYPEPAKVPELAALVKDPKKRRTPGRTKQAICDVLRIRFFSLLPKGNSRRTPRTKTNGNGQASEWNESAALAQLMKSREEFFRSS